MVIAIRDKLTSIDTCQIEGNRERSTKVIKISFLHFRDIFTTVGDRNV